MKQFIYITILLLLASCTAGEEAADRQTAPVAAQVVAVLQGAPAGVISRAVDTSWDPADVIGVYVSGDASTDVMAAAYQNVKYRNTSATVGQGSFVPDEGQGEGIFFQDQAYHTFCAYAPYIETAGYHLSPSPVAINTRDQSSQQRFDYLYATGARASYAAPQVSFTGGNAFCHCMAKVVLVIRMGQGFEPADVADIAAVRLSGLCHDGSFDPIVGTAAVAADAVAIDNWDLTTQPHTTDATSAGTHTYTLILLPQNTLGTPLALDVEHSGITYRNTTDISSCLVGGYQYTYTLSLNKMGLTLEGSTKRPWDSQAEQTGQASLKLPYATVDLGITTIKGGDTYKVLFAQSNLTSTGLADSEEDFGDYFAWAATKPWYAGSELADPNQSVITSMCPDKPGGYTADNAPYYDGSAYSKYTTLNDELEDADDAARQILGEGWSIPTVEMLNQIATSSAITRELVDGTSGIKGVRFTSTQTGESLFLPLAAVCFDSERDVRVGTMGCYLSRNLCKDEGEFQKVVQCLLFMMMSGEDKIVATGNVPRHYGLSVRPVYLVRQ